MYIPAASTSENSPQEDSYEPSSSLSTLPDEVVLDCLARVPRCYDLNLSCVSKNLNSLVRSAELYRLRSLRHKDSVYLCFSDYTNASEWFTLRRSKKTTVEYQLVAVPFPSRYFLFFLSTVSVGSEIYFIGGSSDPSTNLLILDTPSGKLRTGPSMKVARLAHKAAVGVVDGKIYVIGGSDEEIQVEVFDPESQTWEFAGEEKVPCRSRFSASLEGKVYMVELENGRISAYNPREGRSSETMEIMLNDTVKCVCVVENVLYACFSRSGLVWFDTKLNVWKKLVFCDWKTEVYLLYMQVMVGYEGKLAVFWSESKIDTDKKHDIRCTLIALDRVGENISGKIQWCGVVTTLMSAFCVVHCLVASD